MRWRLTLFDGYLISSCGKVWSCKSNKYLKPYKHPQGYLLVSIRDGGKTIKRYVHRLVGEAFLENRGFCEINHIDGNKGNNCLENLEWISRSGNVIHAYSLGLAKSKLTEEDVLNILTDNETPIKELALKFNCSDSNIRGIKEGRNWKHLRGCYL